MGILWMVDGVFCRDPSLGLHLESVAAARTAREQRLQTAAQASHQTAASFESYDETFLSPEVRVDKSMPTSRVVDNRIPEIPLPPPNSEVAAQPRAPLENRASELPHDWETVTAIERTTPIHRRLDTLDSSTATVKDLMTHSLITATSSTPVFEAIELLDETGFHHLPVIDQEHRLIGMVSDRDVLGKEGELKDFMATKVLTASPDTALEQAAEALAKQRFHSLVVVDKERRPVGVLTSSDLLAFLVSHPAMRLWRQG